jgi:hypothetical protein
VKETTVIRVTDRHIAEGKPRSECECPLALAVIEALAADGVIAEAGTVEVDYYDVFVVDGETGCRRYRATLPAEAADFVDDFDDGDPVVPFEVELAWEITA